jgi:hypothetical protein
MIPKKIHYCWLSGDNFPEIVQKCMKSWQEVMPDYELICWDMKKFNIESIPFVSEACSVKKWAFAADYIRMHALFTEGGIYLDTDVILKKRLDELLIHDLFVSVEYHPDIIKEHDTLSLIHSNGAYKEPFTEKPGIGIQAAVIGGTQGHPFLKDCLEWYRRNRFILPGGKYNNVVIAPEIYAMVAEKFGFRYIDERQDLDALTILSSETFAGSAAYETENSYAVHLCIGGWRDKPEKTPMNRLLQRVLQKLRMCAETRLARRISAWRA